MDLSTDSGSYPAPESPNSQSKRANKPLVERKRRGRINKSIDELKQIVLQALNKDDKDYCKMEKADILEMVVRHLKAIRRSQIAVESMGEPAPVWHNYRAGFNECASEVMTYMRGVQGVNPNVQVCMLSHLSDCIQRVNAFPAVDHMTSAPHQPHVAHPMTSPVHHMTSSPHVTATTTTRVTSPIVQARTPETMTSPAPPMLVKCEQPERGYFTSGGVSIVDQKPHRGSPRVDQIVPGSHSPELDLENSSMVDGYDLQLRRASPPSIWSQYNAKVTDRCRSPSLKVKNHMARSPSSPQPAMRNVDRKSIGPIREAHIRSVWRPW